MQDQKCVLVVEDGGMLQSIVAKAMHGLGYLVVVATTAENALARTFSRRIDVALIDLFLPGMGGLAGIAAVRDKWPEAGVVAVAGASLRMGSSDPMLTAAWKAGAHHTLKKPFSPTKLIDKVERLMRGEHAAPRGGRRIMLVEDNMAVRRAVADLLGDAGCLVTEAAGMEDALASPELSHADLLISDIFMPGLGGLQGMEEIRRRHPGLPMIAMSGSVEAGNNGERALRAADKIGAESCLMKPFSGDDLLASVSGVLGSYALSAMPDGQGILPH